MLNVGALAACLLRGQAAVALRAKWDAVRMIPREWRKRTSIQRARRLTTGEVWRMLEGGWPRPGS